MVTTSTRWSSGSPRSMSSTGRYDIIAEVATTDGMNGLYDFLNVSLQKLGGIQSSEMFVVLKASHKWMLLPQATTAAWTGPAAGGP